MVSELHRWYRKQLFITYFAKQDKPLSGMQGSTTESAPCAQFDGYEAIAKFFLTELLEQSAAEAQDRKVVNLEEKELSSSSSSAITFVEFFGSFTSWPTIQEFTVELGEDRIAEYLSTWYYEEDWLYCVDLKLQQSDGCCDYYIYEVSFLFLLSNLLILYFIKMCDAIRDLHYH